MKLILSGGGAGKQVTERSELFSKIVNGNKILYIPLAWDNGPYEERVDWFTNKMKPFEINNIDFITDAKQITKEKLNGVKGIFIGGGNTYKLLKMLKDCDAFENLREFALRDDTVVMGASAGSLIWGKSIDTVKDDELGLEDICDPNYVGLEDASGYNLLNGYSLFVHYKKKEEQVSKTMQRVERLLKEGYKLICLPEETSVVVDNGKLSYIGSKPAEIFDRKYKNLCN